MTSIYWYFRKKDELLNAMTDRALREYVFATPYVEADDWRETLANHARSMRTTFMGNPILCDLILIRSALSPRAAKVGEQEVEKAIDSLVEAGLPRREAFDVYSAVWLHVRGSVVLHRLYEKNRDADHDVHPLEDTIRIGAADDHNFEFGLQCILERAERLIADARPAAKARSKG